MIARAPLPNRVDPFGELTAVAARGTLHGNRGGRFHRGDRALGRRRWASRQWIACALEFRGRRRDVWGAGYTELFFLDEFTALAAGHRPCFECRRAEAEAFRAAFAGGAPIKAAEIDARLHDERQSAGRKRTHAVEIATLPDGAMIARDGAAYLARGPWLLPWTFHGYGDRIARPADGVVQALTPPSILRALAAGYAPRPAAPARPG